MNICLATKEDLNQVLEAVHDWSRFLLTKGIRQWSENYKAEWIEKEIDNGELFVFRNGQEVLSSVSLKEIHNSSPIEGLWENSPITAIHITRLLVRRDQNGRKLGENMLHWVEAKALGESFQKTSLVTDDKNNFLKSYYQRMGYELKSVRFYQPYEMDFALFEKTLKHSN